MFASNMMQLDDTNRASSVIHIFEKLDIIISLDFLSF